MIAVTIRPERAQINDDALESFWVSARQPCIFKLQRRDYELISCHEGVGAITVLKAVYNAAITTEVVAGDQLYWASTLDDEGNAGNYGVVGTVISIATNVGIDHLIYMDWQSEQPTTDGGYFNVVKRLNYYLSGTINVTDSNTAIQHEIPYKLKGGIDGTMILDTSDFLTAYLVKEAPTDYAFINKLNKNVYGKFNLVFREHWTGDTNIDVGDLSQYYFVDGAKQIGELYGQNFCDYHMFPVAVDPLPKWLTDFPSPTFFAGFPFCISFIYPNDMVGETLRRNEVEKDQSGATLSTVQTNMPDSEIDGVNRLLLTETYTSGTKAIDLFVDYNDGVDDVQLLETIVVKLGTVCTKNNVYLCWANSRGGYDYWLFSKNQILGFSSKSVGELNSDPTDLATQNFRSTSIRMESVERIICGATVSIDDFTGIKGIERSPAVYVFTGVSSYTWKRMKVIPKGFQYQKRGVTVDISIELEYPEIYTVSN
jgi:hypothetical protein